MSSFRESFCNLLIAILKILVHAIISTVIRIIFNMAGRSVIIGFWLSDQPERCFDF